MSDLKIIKVTGYMDLSQFTPQEIDESRPSGLAEWMEADLAEDLFEDMDDVRIALVDAGKCDRCNATVAVELLDTHECVKDIV